MIDELIILSKIENLKRKFASHRWNNRYITTSNMQFFLDEFREYIETHIDKEYDEMSQDLFLEVIGVE